VVARKIIKKQRIVFFIPKTKFFTITYYSEKKGLTSPIYYIELLFSVIHNSEIEFRLKDFFFVFVNLRSIFGETYKEKLQIVSEPRRLNIAFLEQSSTEQKICSN